jgi:hypothetical protein
LANFFRKVALRMSLVAVTFSHNLVNQFFKRLLNDFCRPHDVKRTVGLGMRAGFRLTFSHDPLDDEWVQPAAFKPAAWVFSDRAPRKIFY